MVSDFSLLYMWSNLEEWEENDPKYAPHPWQMGHNGHITCNSRSLAERGQEEEQENEQH